MNLKLILSVIALIVQITAVAESQTTQKGLGPNCSDLYQPRVEVLIQEDGGKVAFEFFAQQGCGADYRVVRDEKISSVVVTNPVREEMWKIDAQTGSGPVVSRIIYGVVPAGFVQSVPKVGIASRLERGQAYNVSVQGQGGWGAASFLYHSEGKHSTRN